MAKISHAGVSHTPGEEPEGWTAESGPITPPESPANGDAEWAGEDNDGEETFEEAEDDAASDASGGGDDGDSDPEPEAIAEPGSARIKRPDSSRFA